MKVCLSTVALIALGTGAIACLQSSAAPPYSGPSELALRLTLSAVPDTVVQDGASQSAILIEASHFDGRPVRGLPLRLEIRFDGVIQDFGTLSAKQAVTGDDGRTRVTYTAPPRPSEPVDARAVVTIAAAPEGTDYRAAVERTVDVRLVPPGTVLPPNAPPRADFTFSPAAPEVLTTVAFDGSSTTDEGTPCLAACAYSWEFGDGVSSTGVFASHQFRGPGTFQVRLTATDARGAAGTAARALTVLPGSPPVAVFSASPASPVPGQTIFFTAEGSRAIPPRRLVSYQWNFGSGRTATGVTTTASYGAPGTYIVTLTVEDDAGRRGTASQPLTVGGR